MNAMATAAYRGLRTAENISCWGQLCRMQSQGVQVQTFCASSLAQCFFDAAAAVCPQMRIFCAVPETPLYTAGNAPLFTVCLGNLLANSLTFAQERPQAILTVERQGANAVFTLRDNGKGMQPETLRSALTPWFSQDPYRDGAPPPGLGMGLALAQNYASLYGGILAVQSTFGEGCTVALSLPCCETAEADATQNSGSPVAVNHSAAPLSYTAADFLQNRYSTLYTQLCDACILPL